ncbi:MAG: DUF2802 domain-containing protein [Moraxellaceae bacterium]|nr:DUF2802 domain-containing protein [Moraxellaceae bacterium]MDZ4387042.1 DUF2802 domain-containing protein [Moraxellaceae bacterium]
MNEQLQYWVDQWVQGFESLQAMISPEDAIVLGVALAIFVALLVFVLIWLRRSRKSTVNMGTETIEPGLTAMADGVAEVPARQITAAEFLAQIHGETPVLPKVKTEPRLVLDEQTEPLPENQSDYQPEFAPTAAKSEPTIEASAAAPTEWQQEIQELRLALSAVQDQVRMQSSALLLQSEAIRAMEAYMELLDNRQHSTTAAADSAPVNDYDTAINLATKGVDAETLMARTGISATEAELIQRLHGQAR